MVGDTKDEGWLVVLRRQSARISRRVGLLAVNSRRHSVATQLPAQRSGTAKSSSCMSWDELFQENGQPHKTAGFEKGVAELELWRTVSVCKI